MFTRLERKFASGLKSWLKASHLYSFAYTVYLSQVVYVCIHVECPSFEFAKSLCHQFRFSLLSSSQSFSLGFFFPFYLIPSSLLIDFLVGFIPSLWFWKNHHYSSLTTQIPISVKINFVPIRTSKSQNLKACQYSTSGMCENLPNPMSKTDASLTLLTCFPLRKGWNLT